MFRVNGCGLEWPFITAEKGEECYTVLMNHIWPAHSPHESKVIYSDSGSHPELAFEDQKWGR